MSNVTFQAFVQALGAASALNGTEILAMIQSGNPVQVALGNLLIALNQSSIPTGGNGIYVPAANTLGFANNGSQTGKLTSSVMTMPSYEVTGSGVPNNGIYLPSAGTVGFAASGAQVGTVGAAKQWNLWEPNFSVAALKNAATMDSGTFTGTLTGMTSGTTGTVNWTRSGNIVALYIANSITGTSNSTSMSMTGIPTALQSLNAQTAACLVEDNGIVNSAAIASIAAGTLSFLKLSGTAYSSTAFTASGTKGITAQWGIVYAIQ